MDSINRTSRAKALSLSAGGGLAAFAVLLLAGGCGQTGPDRLYINLDQALKQAEADQPPPLAARTPALPGLEGENSEIPAVPRQIVLGDDMEALTKEALDKVRANQQRLYAQIRERLLEGYEAELAAAMAERREEVLGSYQTDLDQAFEDIRRRFEASAMEAGPLVFRLSWLAGFPDPDPSNRRAPRGNAVEQAMGEEAAEIRPKLAAIRRAYHEAIAAILERIKYDSRADYEALDDVEASEKDRLAARADLEAREAAATALASLVDSAFDAQRTLEGVPAAAVQRTAAPSLPAGSMSPKAREVFPLRDRIMSEARAFAGARGAVLSLDSRGAKDATQEFMEWRNNKGS